VYLIRFYVTCLSWVNTVLIRVLLLQYGNKTACEIDYLLANLVDRIIIFLCYCFLCYFDDMFYCEDLSWFITQNLHWCKGHILINMYVHRDTCNPPTEQIINLSHITAGGIGGIQ